MDNHITIQISGHKWRETVSLLGGYIGELLERIGMRFLVFDARTTAAERAAIIRDAAPSVVVILNTQLAELPHV